MAFAFALFAAQKQQGGGGQYGDGDGPEVGGAPADELREGLGKEGYHGTAAVARRVAIDWLRVA